MGRDKTWIICRESEVRLTTQRETYGAENARTHSQLRHEQCTANCRKQIQHEPLNNITCDNELIIGLLKFVLLRLAYFQSSSEVLQHTFALGLAIFLCRKPIEATSITPNKAETQAGISLVVVIISLVKYSRSSRRLPFQTSASAMACKLKFNTRFIKWSECIAVSIPVLSLQC